MMKKLKIVFMGTPEFGIPTLDCLITNGYQIVGVVTATDKMGGRGGKTLLQSPIKKYAEQHGLAVFQPKNLKSEKFRKQLQSLNPDLAVVIAFRMLPQSIWNLPKYGSYNLHGSLLPKLRGAAPINWAIIQANQTTGVTFFQLNSEIDAGNIICQDTMAISDIETAGSLHDRMKYRAALTTLRGVQLIEKNKDDLNKIVSIQQHSHSSQAPKLFLQNTIIPEDATVIQADSLIRGLYPYPVSWVRWQDKMVKIFRVRYTTTLNNIAADDDAINTKNDRISILLGKLCLRQIDGYLEILELQHEGKKRMSNVEFINGYSQKLKVGSKN